MNTSEPEGHEALSSAVENGTSLRAYQKWDARSQPSGTQLHDWLEAETEVRQLRDLARQLAEVEERLSRQIAAGKEAERRLAAEHAVSRILADSDRLNQAAPKIIQAVCESLDWDVGAVWLVDRNANVLRCVQTWHRAGVEVAAFEQDTRQRTFAPGIELPGRVWADETLIWTPDVTAETNFPRAPIAATEGLHGAVGFPIRKGTEFLGVIEFFSREVRRPDAELVEMMASIGIQIGEFIECKEAERRLTAEHAISRILAASVTLRDAAPRIIQAVCEALDWDVGTLWLVDRNANVLRCFEVWHTATIEIPAFEQECRQHTLSPGIELPGRVWATESLAWLSDVTADASSPRSAIAAREGLHGGIGFPIRNGIALLGVMEFFSREVRQPDERCIAMMTTVGSQITQFIRRREAESELLRHEEERRIARVIQQGLLPKVMPTLPGFQISGRSLTANDVGGDCFDFFPLLVDQGQESLGVLVADASGHGISSALLVGQTRAYLRALALACTDIGTLLTLSNRRLATDIRADHFVTLFLMRLDPRDRYVLYASAGHCPGYVLDRRGRTKAVLASTGVPLGIDFSEFPTGPAVALGPGEQVFLFTDGITEATSPAGDLFGLERTLDVIRAHHEETADEILGALFDSVGDFSRHHFRDDLTAVIIKGVG
jgi:serine phosphatase RsbU (regulator of sigma subunit)